MGLFGALRGDADKGTFEWVAEAFAVERAQRLDDHSLGVLARFVAERTPLPCDDVLAGLLALSLEPAEFVRTREGWAAATLSLGGAWDQSHLPTLH
jgi:hypothetical protein